MQASHPQQSVQPPRPRDEARADSGTLRSQGLVVDLEPVVERPVPDWDWGPDEERRGR